MPLYFQYLERIAKQGSELTPIGKTSNDQMEDNDEEEDEEEDSESDHEDEDEEDVDMTNNFNQEDNVVNQWSKVNSAVTRMLL